ncbi:ParB/RepB/Spo0J family partition protein [Aureimonas psammosilenae]|uniref:ParB/RepB/Spo0J family partition protein n=1 Tax=Aureimonas psammosilenae TaxID=2495496 RepID=UPI0012612D6E|nr:ParB/RepB/Spo0J family partition protein [Aureimonas psammosilenae]
MNEDRSRQRLGRGLASLIGGGDRPVLPRPGFAASNPLQGVPSPVAAIPGERSVPHGSLSPNPRNPRRVFNETDLSELSASIRAHGIVQPILVRPVGAEGRFEIVAGERRWRAAKLAALAEVPIVVREIGDREALEIAIIENVQRSDLNAIEEAEAYRMLIEEHDYTQADLADALGKSRSHVANTLRLLKLPEGVKHMVTVGELSPGHARAAVTAADPEDFARRVAEKGLTVREAEAMARQDAEGSGEGAKPRAGRKRGGEAGETSAPATQASNRDADTVALETLLTDTLGMPVSIDLPGEGGRLRIDYGTLEKLDELCRLLQSLGGRSTGPRIREL